jgi:hypothetical protein
MKHAFKALNPVIRRLFHKVYDLEHELFPLIHEFRFLKRVFYH